jgi:UDP-N-acetylmuramate dehydrogenase
MGGADTITAGNGNDQIDEIGNLAGSSIDGGAGWDSLTLHTNGSTVTLGSNIKGIEKVDEDDHYYFIKAGAGENWHSFVMYCVEQGYAGIENLALIPGSVGASPMQNIGAYGVELQDRFDALDAIDLETGRVFTLDAAQCGFGYRDSVFKHTGSDRHMGLKGRAMILRVRFALPLDWKPVLGYADLEKKQAQKGIAQPTAQQVFDWVCEIRRAKLPDPAVIGNAGSFFKNPTVTAEQCQDIIAREPRLVHYQLADGRFKLAAAWLIDACGWRGKSVGNAAVYEKQALVIVNKGGLTQPCTGGEVVTLAQAIQTSVYERFGIRLEPEPVVV